MESFYMQRPFNLKPSGTARASFRVSASRALLIAACLIAPSMAMADAFTSSERQSQEASEALQRRLEMLEMQFRDLERRDLSQGAARGAFQDTSRATLQEAEDNAPLQEAVSENPKKVYMSELEEAMAKPLPPEYALEVELRAQERLVDMGRINGKHVVKIDDEVKVLTKAEYVVLKEKAHNAVLREFLKENHQNPLNALDLPRPVSQLGPSPLPPELGARQARAATPSSAAKKLPAVPNSGGRVAESASSAPSPTAAAPIKPTKGGLVGDSVAAAQASGGAISAGLDASLSVEEGSSDEIKPEPTSAKDRLEARRAGYRAAPVDHDGGYRAPTRPMNELKD